MKRSKWLSSLTAAVVTVSLLTANMTTALAIESEDTQPDTQNVGTVYYVDATNGDDSNTGTSERQAWQTLDKVSQQTFGPGDTILFKRDETFAGTLILDGSGTSEYPITVDAYGGGDKPHLTTSQKGEQVITLLDDSHWIIQNLEITAPNGGGIWIDCPNKIVEDIVIQNIKFHDISPDENHDRDPTDTAGNGRLAILVGTNRYSQELWVDSYLKDIVISNCEFYNMDNGINTQSNCWFESTGKSYPRNENIIVENCSFRDLWGEAVVLSKTKGMIVRNCSAINTVKGWKNAALASIWYWGCQESVVSNCEIAGSQNHADGMTVDFDDETETSGYEYIYSHDNIRFMRNCYYGSAYYGGDNWVRYCLSVNDNTYGNDNMGGIGAAGERRMKFYNNTIYNGSYFTLPGDGQVIKNNIFHMLPGQNVQYRGSDLDISNNCYYSADGSEVEVVKNYQPFTDEEGRITEDPMFVNVNADSKDGFKLRKESPCIGAGVVVPDRGSRDLYGTALTDDMHNIGAYEGDGIDTGTQKEYTVSASSEIDGVTFEGIGTFIEGSNITVKPSIPQGYVFDHWCDESGNFLSYNEFYTIYSLNGDVSIKVVCREDKNLVVETGVTASAESEFSEDYTANKVIDGTTANDSRWASKTISGIDGTINTWLEVDLGKVQEISCIGINWARGAADACGIDYSIQVSSDRSDWHQVANVTDNHTSDQYLNYQFEKTPAQYIKVQITRCEPVAPSSFYDLTVYGDAPEQQNTATISATVNDKLYGKVTGAWRYPVGETAVLTAAPRNGYEFVNWTDSEGNEVVTNETLKITVNSDQSYIANFRPETAETFPCEISVLANNNQYGTVFGGVTYTSGEDVTLTAVAKSGYKFVSWTDAEGNIVSKNSRYSLINLNQDVDLTANFEKLESPVEVSVYKNTPNNNHVSGAGIYEAGDNVVLSAIAEKGYKFIEWQDENGSTLSQEAFWKIDSIQKNMECTAVFKKISSYNIKAQANVPGGTISGCGIYLDGETVSLSANSIDGYIFMGWIDQYGNVLGKQQNLVVKDIHEDLDLVASYRKAVVDGEDLAYGKTVETSSVFSEGYEGKHLTDGADTIYPDDSPVDQGLKTRWASGLNGTHWFYVDMEEAVTFDTVSIDWTDAYGNGYIIQVSEDAKEWKTICEVAAAEAAGYSQKRALHSFAPVTARYVRLESPTGAWGTLISLYDFNVYTNAYYEVTASVNDEAYGEVKGTGLYMEGDFVQLNAVAKEGYRFVNWTDETGAEVSTSPVYRIMNAEQDLHLQANFEENPVMVTKLEVKQLPNQTEYKVGDALNLEGGVLLVTYSDGSVQEVPMTAEMVSGFDSTTPGEKELTVTYEGKTAAFTVTVVEDEPEATVEKIEVKQLPKKMEYQLGERLNLEGGVLLVTYSDGSVQEVAMTAEMVSGFDSATPGKKELTVTYEGKEVSIKVLVKDGESPDPENPGEPENPDVPENPDTPNEPENPTTGDAFPIVGTALLSLTALCLLVIKKREIVQ